MSFFASCVANRVANPSSSIVKQVAQLGNKVVTRQFSNGYSDANQIILQANERLQYCMQFCYDEKNDTYGPCSQKAIEVLRGAGVTITYTTPEDPSTIHVVQLTDDQVHKMHCPFSDGPVKK